MVNFVRPGLAFTIVSHEIAADGTLKVRFKLTDPKGLPLDRAGITTPGTIATSFIVARIPQGGTHYQSYTTRSRTSALPATAGQTSLQAAADAGGNYATVAEGEYTYTFGTKLPADYPKDATTTIGMWGTRNLTEFDLGTNKATTLYHFVPNGTAVVDTRDVVKNQTCNKCHEDLYSHGSRVGLELCVMCHTPAYGNVKNINPQTGNTVDMSVTVHKIHNGADLPSVKAGTPYQFIASSVHDYSEVRIPSEQETAHFATSPAASKEQTTC